MGIEGFGLMRPVIRQSPGEISKMSIHLYCAMHVLCPVIPYVTIKTELTGVLVV